MKTDVSESSDMCIKSHITDNDTKDTLHPDVSMTLSNDTGITVDVSTDDMKNDLSNLSNNICKAGDRSTPTLQRDLEGVSKSGGNENVPRSKLMKQKGLIVLKKFLVFLFSHVGLTCLVVCYSLFGAFIFQKLEQWNEKESRVITSKLRNDTLGKLWNLTRYNNILRKPNWTDQAETVLRSFEKEIYIATKQLGWDGVSNEAVGELQWSFTGSLLYSVTVITTIGYGHITPKTPWGRIVTMVYAFIGIPLTLLCLANIGALLGKGFLVLYNKIHNRQDFGLKSALPIPQSVVKHEKVKCDDGSVIEDSPVLVYIPSRNLQPSGHVPIVICILLVIMYTLIGTIIFHIWETSWDVLTSAYFCFITLSTIGFGDVVPGHSLDSWQSQPKQFICTIYLLFGLTLLAMCFDLLQEQVRTIARRFGEFLGIMDEDEDKDEIDDETNIHHEDEK